MKHFICTLREVKASYCADIINNVYQIKKGRPVHVGMTRYNSGAMKGHSSEAMDVLLHFKLISKKLFKETGGYYTPNKHFTIDVL